MKLFSQFKSFWKFFASSAAVITLLLVCAILVASMLIKDVYLTNLKDHMDNSAQLIVQEIDDTLAGMEAEVAIIEKNENLSVATLYAFDDLVNDGSYLINELTELRHAIGITAIAVKSVENGRVVISADSKDGAIGNELRTLLEGSAENMSADWHRIDNRYFLMAEGSIVNLNETLARIYLVKEAGAQYLSGLSKRINASVLLEDDANKVIASSGGLPETKSIACGPGLLEGSIALGGTHYYYECTRLGAETAAPMLVHLYDGSVLWEAIERTNEYLWIIGAALILISIILNLVVTKSFAAPVKALSKLMGVEASDDLPLTFERIETTTRKYQKDLAKKSYLEAVGETSSMIAHDIRKPFSSMKSLLKMLPEKKDDPVFIKEAAADVDEAIDKTESMLSDILEYTRGTELSRGDVGIKGMITAALVDAFKDVEGADISVKYCFRHKLTTDVDEVKITRVFANIVDNAVAATEGLGTIWIETNETQDKRWVEIRLANDGPKIEEEDKSKLFQLFYTRGKRRGSGLGLAICSRFVRVHGGSIHVESDDERTEFVIKLPAGKSEERFQDKMLIRHSRDVAGRDGEVTVRETAWEDTDKSVLIVNDEEFMRVAVRHELNRTCTAKVLEAGDVEEALDLIEHEKVDVVLADIDLKAGENGYDLLRKVKERGNGVKFYMMSGMSKEEEWPKAESLGADGYIQVPYEGEDLRKAIYQSVNLI